MSTLSNRTMWTPEQYRTYLLSLPAIRTKANIVYSAAQFGETSHFNLHEEKLDETADYVTSIILDSYPIDKLETIPPHGRWQHFEVQGQPRVEIIINRHQAISGVNDIEVTKMLVDLFVVSVLLDAGAGDAWVFTEQLAWRQLQMNRSEGLAVASYYMFKEGLFDSEGSLRCNGKGLQQLSVETLAKGMQTGPQNSLVGLEGRAKILNALGSSLEQNFEIFGREGRPGNIVDYLLGKHPDKQLDVATLWSALQTLLIPIWPADRTNIEGHPLGDAWPLSTLARHAAKGGQTETFAAIQPFHKLTQWLAYSLMVPFVRILGATWTNHQLLTGLPEYRNGGLFVDIGVLSLKPESLERGKKRSGQELPEFDGSDDVIVEWRALTVVLLDDMLALVNKRLLERGAKKELSLAQMLEAGTWKAGRKIAAEKRPATKGSPILIASDGTLF